MKFNLTDLQSSRLLKGESKISASSSSQDEQEMWQLLFQTYLISARYCILKERIGQLARTKLVKNRNKCS